MKKGRRRGKGLNELECSIYFGLGRVAFNNSVLAAYRETASVAHPTAASEMI